MLRLQGQGGKMVSWPQALQRDVNLNLNAQSNLDVVLRPQPNVINAMVGNISGFNRGMGDPNQMVNIEAGN